MTERVRNITGGIAAPYPLEHVRIRKKAAVLSYTMIGIAMVDKGKIAFAQESLPEIQKTIQQEISSRSEALR